MSEYLQVTREQIITMYIQGFRAGESGIITREEFIKFINEEWRN